MSDKKSCAILFLWETREPKGGLPSDTFGGANPPDERKEGDTMVTYSDLVQIGILIVALVGLIYEIIKDKKK